MTPAATMTSELDHLDRLGAKAFVGFLVRKDLVRTGEEELFKARSRDQGSVKIIDLVRARLDTRRDSYGRSASPVCGRSTRHRRAVVNTTKPRALAPGVCLLSRGVVPWDRAQGSWAQLCEGCSQETAVRGNSLIVFRSEGLGLWGGAAGAGTWGQVSIGMFR